MEESDLSAETREWLEALNSVQEFEGVARVDGLLSDVVAEARKNGAKLPFAWNTAYINTIPPEQQPPHPGVREIETKIRAAIRWNAAMLVLKANKASSELGGHIACFQSAATLYDVGFMHFWRAPDDASRRRPDLHPGPFLAWHLRPRLPRGAHFRRADAQFPPGGGRQGPFLLSASLADAGFLAVPDRLHGPRPADGDLSGPFPALSRRTRPDRNP